MTLALAGGPFRGLRQARSRSKPPSGGAVLSRATPRTVAGRGRVWAAAQRLGVVLWQQVCPEAGGLLPAQQSWLGVSNLCSRSAPGPGWKSSPALPVCARGTGSDLQPGTGQTQPQFPRAAGPRGFCAFPAIHLRPHCPPSPGIVSYPVHGACSSVPGAHRSCAAPQYQRPSSSPATAGFA